MTWQNILFITGKFHRIMNKFIFLLKKPSVVVVAGNGRTCASEVISRVLKQFFRAGEQILIFDVKNEEIKNFEFFLKRSPRAILVITHIGNIPSDIDFFAGEMEEIKEIINLAKRLPAQTNLILNFDDETVGGINDITNLNTLTFGFQEKADFRATDVKSNRGTNLKINFRGNIVPFWLEGIFGKEQIYSVLATVAVGSVLNLNLVEISQTLKNYQPQRGDT